MRSEKERNKKKAKTREATEVDPRIEIGRWVRYSRRIRGSGVEGGGRAPAESR